jgi:hypothetical protein
LGTGATGGNGGNYSGSKEGNGGGGGGYYGGYAKGDNTAQSSTTGGGGGSGYTATSVEGLGTISGTHLKAGNSSTIPNTAGTGDETGHSESGYAKISIPLN